jgi:hypothetical protein
VARAGATATALWPEGRFTYNRPMIDLRLNTGAIAATIIVVLFLALLALRGLKSSSMGERRPRLVWGETGEDDLFRDEP